MFCRLLLLSERRRCSAMPTINPEEVAVEVVVCQWAVVMLATSLVETSTA